MKKLLLFLLILTLVISGCRLPAPVEESSAVEESSTVLVDGSAVIRVLDIGQGDCILIEIGDKFVLIDSGDYRTKKSTIEKIKSYDVEDIEYVIFTHPHADHIGAAAEVVTEFKVANVIMPNATHTSATYNNLITALENDESIKVIEGKAGVSFAVDSAEFKVLSPFGGTHKDLNEYSVVLLMTLGDFAMLFMGDAIAVNETAILNNHTLPQIDVLKVGHHGSNTSSSDNFIKSIKPTYAVISLGEVNTYGHPHQETLDTLGKYQVSILRTDQNGTVTIETNGNGFEITGER